MEKGIKKIAVIGAESTGKTTLCQKLALHYKTNWVPEFARAYFESNSINACKLYDIELIARQQIKNEKAFSKNANRLLFCDTNLITLKIWADLEFKSNIAFIDEMLLKDCYDLTLVLNNTIDWQQDEQRKNKFNRDFILELNVQHLKSLNRPFKVVSPKNWSEITELISSI